MPLAWYLVPYKRRAGTVEPERYCALDDFTAQVTDWTETEVLGDRAIVKVRAAAGVLSALNAEPGFVRLPKDAIDDSLSDLTQGQKNALKGILTDMGYTLQEIQARFGSDLGAYTLRDVLKFMATRRLKPRHDRAADTIVLDGEIQACRPVEDVDRKVQ